MFTQRMDTRLPLDHTDYAILQHLQDHAKLTNAQLAQNVGLSPAATLERVKKLERQGVIKSYHAKLDPEQLALRTCILIQIKLRRLAKKDVDAFKTCIAHIPEVVTCYQVVGSVDFLIKVITTDIAAYQHVVTHQLSKVEGIQHMQAFVVAASLKDTGVPVLPPGDT